MSDELQTSRLYEVASEGSGQRLDRYLAEQEPELSRSYLQKLIREGRVLTDGKPAKAATKLAAGMKILLDIPEAKEPEILPEDLRLDGIYEAQDEIQLNKPKVMVVHPPAGHDT